MSAAYVAELEDFIKICKWKIAELIKENCHLAKENKELHELLTQMLERLKSQMPPPTPRKAPGPKKRL